MLPRSNEGWVIWIEEQKYKSSYESEKNTMLYGVLFISDNIN